MSQHESTRSSGCGPHGTHPMVGGAQVYCGDTAVALSNSMDLQSPGKCGTEVILTTKEMSSLVAKLSQVS